MKCDWDCTETLHPLMNYAHFLPFTAALQVAELVMGVVLASMNEVKYVCSNEYILDATITESPWANCKCYDYLSRHL